MDFTVSADRIVKISENEKYLDPTREPEKLWNKGDSDTSCNGCTWNDPPTLRKMAGGVGNRRSSIQSTAILRSDRTLTRVLETLGD